MTAGLVIVGAGVCGVSAAAAAREAGFGGAITLIGDDPEWPYERPPLSKWGTGGPILRPIFPPEFYQDAQITLMRGTKVAGIDRTSQTVTLKSGAALAFDRLLLATGAAPRQISLAHLTQMRPAYLRDFAQAQTLSTQVSAGADTLIIGGGFIGLELAASFSARRSFVHVIEVQDRILSRAVPAPIARKVHDLHTQNGVTIHTDTHLTALTDGVAQLSNGLSVRAGHIIAGVGSVPNLELAEEAGLNTDNGIVVDGCFRTSASNIYAAGDCCAAPMEGAGSIRMESWQVAAEQGRRAGQILARGIPDAPTPPWFWSDQFDHSLQVVGWPPDRAEYITRILPSGGMLCIALSEQGQIAHAAGFAPGHSVGRDIKLIQKIMQAEIRPAPRDLEDPATSFRSILKRR